MPKVILSTHVFGDGTGDFHHLMGLCKFLKDKPSMKDYEFILIVTCVWDSLIPYFKTCLESLDINNIYLSTRNNFKHDFLHNESLIRDLGEAEQIIRISSDTGIVDSDEDFKKYINPNVIIKYIGEHERESSLSNIPSFSLGLGDETYGIKLEAIERLSSIAAFHIFEGNDPVFAKALLAHTSSHHAEDLFTHNILIPAYFNNQLPLFRMLLLLGINENLPANKNIIINLSGSLGEGFIEDFQEMTSRNSFFQNSNIKEVSIIDRSTNQASSFSNNNNGSRTIYIFNGFKVSDKSYLAMHQQTMFDGVSGDNTFELAVSVKALPYYHSTNASNKKETILSLINIISTKISLPDNVKHDFLTYFENIHDWCQIIDRYNKAGISKITEKFKCLNLPKMMEAWPLIADYLIRHYNFYDKVEDIVTGKPLINNGEYFLSHTDFSVNQSSITSAPSVSTKSTSHTFFSSTQSKEPLENECSEEKHKPLNIG